MLGGVVLEGRFQDQRVIQHDSFFSADRFSKTESEMSGKLFYFFTDITFYPESLILGLKL